MKVVWWECSFDLCSYLSDQIQISQSQFRNSVSVSLQETGKNGNGIGNGIHRAFSNDGFTLELGCGHDGLPAIVILKEIVRRYKHWEHTSESSDLALEGYDSHSCVSHSNRNSPSVVFADYNSFVLRDVTLPNIILNTCTFNENKLEMGNMAIEEMKKKLKEHTSLVSGDWLELSKQLKQGSGVGSGSSGLSCLSSKKIKYASRWKIWFVSGTPKAAQDTAYWLCNHLKPHTGVGLIATKRYYFGVGLGGGSDAFQNACANEKVHCTSDGDGDGESTNSYRLSIELVQQYNDGKSNIWVSIIFLLPATKSFMEWISIALITSVHCNNIACEHVTMLTS